MMNLFTIGPVGGLNGTGSTEMIFEDLLRYFMIRESEVA
jgi:hypothetical protein